jgi:hypothetical protein
VQYGGGRKQQITFDNLSSSNYLTMQALSGGTGVCPCAHNTITVGDVASLNLTLRAWCAGDYTADRDALSTRFKAFCVTHPEYVSPTSKMQVCSGGAPSGSSAGNVDVFCRYYHHVCMRRVTPVFLYLCACLRACERAPCVRVVVQCGCV